MNSFKNCGSDYRAIVFTPAGLGEFRLADVEYKSRESTYQTLDDDTDIILGVHERQLRLATPEKSRKTTFADPLVKMLFNQNPWLYDWLYSRQKGIPERIVPRRQYVITQLRKQMIFKDCVRWGLPLGIAEALAEQADHFTLTVTGQAADFRRTRIPSGTFLYGVTQRGGRSERIVSWDGFNMVHGYPTILEVTPKKGEIIVHANTVHNDAQDWVSDLAYYQANRKKFYFVE